VTKIMMIAPLCVGHVDDAPKSRDPCPVCEIL